MVLNRSLEIKGAVFQIVYVAEIQFESAWALAIVQIVCVVEIQFESAWALTNLNSGTTC